MTKQSPLALELDGVGAVDSDGRPTEPPEGSAPPHPFRTSPWYDPAAHRREVEQELRKTEPLARLPRRRVAAFVLVILGGVVLPIASLVANHVVEHVVALGAGGTAALILAVLATLANLLLLPTRKTASGQVLVRAPQSRLLCALLAASALLSAIFWGYLSLLFMPLAPISVVAIVFFGLGLCGLSPHFAAAVAIIQTLRACKLLGRRLGAGRTAGMMVGVALLPVLLAGAAGVNTRVRQARFDELVGRIAEAKPHSSARMQLIAQLSGEEERVTTTYWRSTDQERQRTLAEIYHRLTDEQLTSAHYIVHNKTLVRPWWFLEPEDRSRGGGPYTFLHQIFGGRLL